jgi:hypothetical protein
MIIIVVIIIIGYFYLTFALEKKLNITIFRDATPSSLGYTAPYTTSTAVRTSAPTHFTKSTQIFGQFAGDDFRITYITLHTCNPGLSDCVIKATLTNDANTSESRPAVSR